MLILSRKEGQRLCIGRDVKVMVVAIRGDKVRLGIEASQAVSIDREEVRQAKERNGAFKADNQE